MASSEEPEKPKVDEVDQAEGSESEPQEKEVASKKKKKVAPSGLSRLKGAALEILRGLWAPEWKARQMSFLFFVSCLGIAYSAFLLTNAFQSGNLPVEDLATEVGQDFEEESKEEDIRTKPFPMGSFTVSLYSDPERPPPRGMVNMIEFDLYIECDVEETCEALKHDQVRVRDQVLRKMVRLDRDDALTKDGKRRLRESIRKILNGWLSKGEVKAVYFSKLLVG